MSDDFVIAPHGNPESRSRCVERRTALEGEPEKIPKGRKLTPPLQTEAGPKTSYVVDSKGQL